jgi:hypothetical protein
MFVVCLVMVSHICSPPPSRSKNCYSKVLALQFLVIPLFVVPQILDF